MEPDVLATFPKGAWAGGPQAAKPHLLGTHQDHPCLASQLAVTVAPSHPGPLVLHRDPQAIWGGAARGYLGGSGGGSLARKCLPSRGLGRFKGTEAGGRHTLEEEFRVRLEPWGVYWVPEPRAKARGRPPSRVRRAWTPGPGWHVLGVCVPWGPLARLSLFGLSVWGSARVGAHKLRVLVSKAGSAPGLSGLTPRRCEALGLLPPTCSLGRSG